VTDDDDLGLRSLRQGHEDAEDDGADHDSHSPQNTKSMATLTVLTGLPTGRGTGPN
jgi:hypothetical protein